mmetsp:Transcript_43255/g.82544  ORF Transcript_43255/g.82544 Transcript_43255/m.82544 type:complete len:177 (-) Transcript_43255:178-708(-)
MPTSQIALRTCREQSVSTLPLFMELFELRKTLSLRLIQRPKDSTSPFISEEKDGRPKRFPIFMDMALDAVVAVIYNSKRLKSEFQDRLIAQELEDKAKAAERELQTIKEACKAELEAWDQRFDFRRATRPELVMMAKQRGMRGYSKMRKEELREAIEYWDTMVLSKRNDIDPSNET